MHTSLPVPATERNLVWEREIVTRGSGQWFWSLGLLWLAAGAIRAGDVDYGREVKPVFRQHCVACHGPEKQRGGLRLDTAAGMRRGGNSGPALVPGQSDASRLAQAIRGSGMVKRMPPREPRLSAEEVQRICRWIDAGAPAPADEAPAVAPRHWAFVSPTRPPLPKVEHAAWVRNPIDRFILARLEREHLTPAPEADRATLLRRVSMDLLGLPPTPAEIEQFLADPRPDAYERVVNRLLNSPHYGERWGRHWLDLARYADSNGYSIDAPRSIWKYRDWVVAALNHDLPFDRFTIDQLAGDLLPGATIEDQVATGFHRNTPFNEEGGIDLEQFRIESIVDRVNTTGAVFLGITLGCAQCHDHKFDPFSQRDYYQFFAFFNNAEEPVLEVPGAGQVSERARVRAQIDGVARRLHQLDLTSPEKQTAWEKSLSTPAINAMPPAIRSILYIPPHQRSPQQHRTLAEAFRDADRVRHVIGGIGDPWRVALHAHALYIRRGLEEEIAQLEKSEPVIPTTLVMRERPQPRATYIHLGGDFLRKGTPVAADVPAVLPPLPTNRSRNRLDLARWLVDPRHPLTGRVTMNRLWQQYFGLGLVETENDFGTQGTPPSHPELLDWLAVEFPARGWSLKTMHRLIVTSATYRQSSRARPELAGIDPRNRLLARQARLRLDAEIVRDVALAASGLLSERMGGPGVFPPQPEGVYRFTQVKRDWPESQGPDRYRRGLYTTFWRSAGYPSLTVFDAPNAVGACTRRIRSNTPLQSLTLLNDRAYFEVAQGLSARLLRETPRGPERLQRAFQLCLGRSPTEREQRRMETFLAAQEAELALQPESARRLAPAGGLTRAEISEGAAWTQVARVLLNLDEFITRE